MRQIELPKKRQDCNMSTWHRVTEKDGSTIAYCPDIVTAREIATIPELIEACESIINRTVNGALLYKRINMGVAEDICKTLRTVIKKAKGES